MTYNVFSGTLNPTESQLNLKASPYNNQQNTDLISFRPSSPLD